MELPFIISFMNILLVEDDEQFAETLNLFFSQPILKEKKFKLFHSKTTNDAFVKLRNQKFDIVLLDLQVGASNGVQVLTSVREDKGHTNFHTPFIIVSGYLNPVTISKLQKFCQGILVKPIEPKPLLEKIIQVSAANKKK